MDATNFTAMNYHLQGDLAIVQSIMKSLIPESEFRYTFENFFHPLADQLIEQLNKESIPGLLDPGFLSHRDTNWFGECYTAAAPSAQVSLGEPPVKEIDLSAGGSYASYNWELLFHIPFTIAVHLSKNQRFAEAQRWFHFIFDPTAPPEYWKFLRFRQESAGKQTDELLALLSKPDAECTDTERAEKESTLDGYRKIFERPFQPHAVARTRPLAYRYAVVMKYLDNLIAWGDHLFRQDTLESINEATQLYVLAANILGKRPEKIPLLGKVRPKTFAELKKKGLDEMGNALVEMEGQFPFNLGAPTASEDADAAAALFGIGRTLYFCIPQNDTLLRYWDTVADRLFKIRHCLNIEGVLRPLALFDPPLDPGMLVKAAAAGIDIGAVVAGLNQPVSPVRAQILIHKALELCAEVRSLGASLLQAIEKGDSERLAVLRQGNEIKVSQLLQDVRFLQWKQAQAATESLLKYRAAVLERYTRYRQLSQAPDANPAPEALPVDRPELTEENFDEMYEALVSRYDTEVPLQPSPRLTFRQGGAPAEQAGAAGQGQLHLTTTEADELGRMRQAKDTGLQASVAEAGASLLVFTPDSNGDLHFWGTGATLTFPVGTALVKSAELFARILRTESAWHHDRANITRRTAEHERRADDWAFQANVAARELRQAGRQIITSLIAEQVAYREYQNVQQQIELARETDRFLQEKFSNTELYAWMQGELTRLYYDYYRFAFDIARRAEQTMKRELMRPELDAQEFVKFNYWDGGRKGLLSGEALHLDVKRMEMAYHEHNLREYELTRHVSLLQVDPLALISLRTTGRCTVRLPEALFDLDGPGHYFRRIKTVALSIPCVTGPYAGVNCRLTLLKSSIRTSPLGSYPRAPGGDDRFQDYFGSVESVVASSAQHDSGLFETNLQDDRYLPFENAGVISEWQLELPANPSQGDPAQFDYNTIADAVLHISYTAREGGAQLRQAALQHIATLVNEARDVGTVRLFDVRHEFPTEWAKFTSQTPKPNRRYELTLTLLSEHYPFWSQGRLNSVVRVDLFARSAAAQPPATITVADTPDAPAGSGSVLSNQDGLLVGKLTVGLPATPAPENWKLYLDDAHFSDLWIAVTWSG